MCYSFWRKPLKVGDTNLKLLRNLNSLCLKDSLNIIKKVECIILEYFI